MFNSIKNILANRAGEYNKKPGRDRSTKERDLQMQAMYRAGHSLEEIGEDFNLTRSRVQQILSTGMEDYKSHNKTKGIKAKPLQKVKCQYEKCGQEFECKGGKKKFCSRECMRISRKKINYPDWVNDRPIQKKYFSEDEWRKINAIRANHYYHNNKEKQRKYANDRYHQNPDRQALYYKRHIERKKHGKAITELPGEKYYSSKP